MARSAFAAVTNLLLTLLLLATSAQAAPVRSAWLQAEQARFTRLLATRNADVLVVPFQVVGHGFDPAERLLMATQLTDTLAAGTRLSFADPILVNRALGEGLRNHDEIQMRQLASLMQAKFLIIGSVGHDQRSSFRLAVRVLRQTRSGEWQEAGQRSWPALSLNDDRPPYQLVPPLAPAIAELLLSKLDSPRLGAASNAVLPGPLSELQTLVSSSQSVNVHVAQLLAMSYPRSPEGPAERAWIRSLRLLQAAGPGGEQRLARARALLHLGRRPAALAALATPGTDAENSLRSVLDGNLSDAEQFTRKISDPVLRLLALIEVRDLRNAYLSDDYRATLQSMQTVVRRDSDWYPLLSARVEHEASRWGGEHALATVSRFSRLLDARELSGTSIEALLKSSDGADVSVQLARQAFTAYDSQLAKFKPLPAKADTLRWLLLDLLQVQVVAGFLADGYATIDTRDQPGHKLLAMQDPLLQGHPDFEAMYANMAWREYARYRGKQREKWQVQALARTLGAYTLSGKSTAAIQNAERRADWTNQIAGQLQAARVESFWTWPVQAGWLTNAVLEDTAAMHWYADRAVQYATTEYPMLAWLKNHDLLKDRKAQIAKSLTGRFDGSADFAEGQAADLLIQDNPAAAEVILKRYVDARLAAFEPYREYLDLLVSQGRYAEGYKMVMKHPSFDPDSPGNRVAASNNAGGAAYYFWHTGKFEYAVPLLERSAGYDTGSAMSLNSEAKLALYKRDYAGAARVYMQIARRYSDLRALSEYFELIFALGRKEEAWRIYQEVYRDGNGGRVLSTIAQHSRQIGWSEQQAIDWLATPKNAVLADDTFYYAPRAALSAAIVDRTPVGDLAAVLRRFDMPSPYVLDKAKGKIVRRIDPKRPASRTPQVCGPSRYGNGPVGGMAQIQNVDSSLNYFARGYQALDRRQYAESFQHFDAAARLFESYDSDCEAVSYMLPYLALAAGHTRNTAALRDYMRTVKYRDRNVNYNLVLAVLAGFEGRHADAGKNLDSALYRWTSSGYQTLPAPYIYADVLERLFIQTRHPNYRKRLVDWARVRQRIGPAEAWAYAKEYRYSEVAEHRKAALAMALFLDPESATLKGVSATEAAAARALLEQGNPFVTAKAKAAAAMRARTGETMVVRATSAGEQMRAH